MSGSIDPLPQAALPSVAHVMAGSPAGGAELFYERLCAAHQREGRRLLSVIRRDDARAARLNRADVFPKMLAFGGALDLLTRPRLGRLLKAFAPAVTVAWMSRAARMTPRGPWTLAGRLGGYYDLSTYRHCDHLIGNTRGLAEWMVSQGWAASRVHHLPNFATDFGTVAPRRPDFLPPDAPFVLALGRLHANKGFDVLIRAMVHVPGAHLVIAGEGPERAALETLARGGGVADRVHMPGWVQDSGALLRACDVLVCSSRIEPLGNVVIEAQSAAVPVVATAIQGPHEILEGTQDGLLADVEDPRSLGLRIAEVLEDRALAEMLARNGRARFEREFAEPVVMAQWRAFLATVGQA
ncbi:glycosyltransferase [Tanticharoenia sakaeratensis]|uniref:Lipopolysaccharide core biosynthesis glycosyl transferase LpsE n=1 Tax=Tanticharoenia sakaeratensis NBRC 103193 TaxID=1231623 RepID=A0A0D6MI91_9PROT|nr:glycosyltransferase [Tanticharoenia sakaeratensis]GAN53226.1 lipopolysaccharide core biosynthesis glycosyl transferase LpsE [Tanticharoenia sakaeratensis NBRC 103193]GBQ21251.1 glycosyltransferase [Tanticharoenia sakaeratensis NBRC 103193]